MSVQRIFARKRTAPPTLFDGPLPDRGIFARKIRLATSWERCSRTSGIVSAAIYRLLMTERARREALDA